MKALCSTGMLFGRILISLIFIVAGLSKVPNFNATVAAMSAMHIPLPQVSLVFAIILEVIGGLFILIGYKTRLMALLMFLFLLPVTYYFHHFWDLSDPEKTIQMQMFLKNLSILGGFLYLASTGPGSISVDHCLSGGSCCEYAHKHDSVKKPPVITPPLPPSPTITPEHTETIDKNNS